MTAASSVHLGQFIELASHQSVLTRLDIAVARKRLCTLVGPMGCGKTWLLDYWRRLRPREPHQPRPSEVLYVCLRPDRDLAIPTTCQLYSKLWHALQRLDRPAHLPTRSSGADADEDEIKMYNARQLQELFPKFIEKAGRRNIRALIVDNAHYLDTTALDWLLDARTYYDEQRGPRPARAIILAGHRDTPAGKVLLDKIRGRDRKSRGDTKTQGMSEAEAAWTGHDIEMSLLSLDDFFEALGWAMRRNLQAEFATDIHQQRETLDLWKLAGGNRVKADDGRWVEMTGAGWREFGTIIEALDEELGPWDGKRPRAITREVLERVKRLLKGDE